MKNKTTQTPDAVPAVTPANQDCFVYPPMTQERAEEIADELLLHSPDDDRVLLLAAELALGLAPANPSREDLNRADAAAAFVERAFRNVRAFNDYCDGLRRCLADPESRGVLHKKLAREYFIQDGGDPARLDG